MPSFGIIEVIALRDDMLVKVQVLETLCLDSQMTGYEVSHNVHKYIQVPGKQLSPPLVSIVRKTRRYVANVGLD